MMRGYAAEGPCLTAEEIEHLSCWRTITLELASGCQRCHGRRVFAFDGDRYATRRAHNIARTQAMLFLADDMKAHQTDMRALVTEYMGR